MIIGCYGHFKTVPDQFKTYPKLQIAKFKAGRNSGFAASPAVLNDELRKAPEANQNHLQKERGIDMTLFSPPAGLMGHDRGSEAISQHWAVASKDIIHRASTLCPSRFAAESRRCALH